MPLSEKDRQTLLRLRENFLQVEEDRRAVDYWRSRQDLELYDNYFARRIYYKARAVFENLKDLNWEVAFPLLDWGCGTGAALEALLDVFQPSKGQVLLEDQSELAVRYAREKLQKSYPQISFEEGKLSKQRPVSFLESHVLGELGVDALKKMENYLMDVEQIVLIEAGTQSHFQRLSQIRESLRHSHQVWAPCTFQARCPMLEKENFRHWCHHFARAPAEFFTEAKWADFSKLVGVDLRSLPYSFLALQRHKPEKALISKFRSIGRARFSKGYARILSCSEDLKLQELTLEKRTHKELFKELRKKGLKADYQFEVDTAQKVVAVLDRRTKKD